MKKKLIRRSNARNEYLLSLGRIFYNIIYRERVANKVRKQKHKYQEVLDFGNTSLMFRRLISVPVVVKPYCKKSRLNGKVLSYRVFSNIEQYNAESGLNITIRDIKKFE